MRLLSKQLMLALLFIIWQEHIKRDLLQRILTGKEKKGKKKLRQHLFTILEPLVAMISAADVYHVVTATVPLYFAMILAYISVKWWKLFTPDQCAGINKFVAKFSIPLLSFQVISGINPYKMNLKLIFADFLQKLLALLVLTALAKISSRGRLNWIITGLSLSTLPNTLILGIPLLRAMYGAEAEPLLSQIVGLQSLIWYNLLLFLFELNATKEATVAPSSESTGDLEALQEAQHKEDEGVQRRTRKAKAMVILLTVVRKLMSNPNFYATLVALIWASIHSRWRVNLPDIVDKSVRILSTGGLGMAMFSLGLFMASRPSIIACGIRMAMVAMAMKFIVGPALMAVASIAVGLKGTVLKVAIVQAALPQGIVPFVFAKEYNVHPDTLSTGVIFGMLISMPIALAYYSLLAL
ncbi:probable auxin efflux carrier component 8 [Populus alba]